MCSRVEPSIERRINPPTHMREDVPTEEDARSRRYRLRRVAGRVLGGEHRTSRCGHCSSTQTVQVMKRPTGRCGYQGVVTCGSIWTCPECASKISAKRSAEVCELVKAHRKAGGACYMGTLTMEHGLGDDCRILRETASWSWDQLIRSGAMRRLRDQYNIVGYVRSLEVTHGKHGWHPHLHVLFLARDMSREQQTAVADAIFERWKHVLERRKIKVARMAFDFQRATNDEAAAQYVAKWGAGTEIAKGSEKLGRAGRSPWQLLDDCHAGDDHAGRLFKEYAEAFHGARHLTYARGIRDMYGLRKQQQDEQLALDDFPEFEETIEVYRIDRQLWRHLVERNLTAQVLSAAEADGKYGIDALLIRHGLAPSHDRPPDHDRRRTPKATYGVKVQNYGGVREELRNLKNAKRTSIFN